MRLKNVIFFLDIYSSYEKEKNLRSFEVVDADKEPDDKENNDLKTENREDSYPEQEDKSESKESKPNQTVPALLVKMVYSGKNIYFSNECESLKPI